MSFRTERQRSEESLEPCKKGRNLLAKCVNSRAEENWLFPQRSYLSE